MTTHPPTPAQPVVLEALRIAEEAKTYVNDLVNWRQGDSESGSAAAWQSAIMSIDRLAALVQPLEAPADDEMTSEARYRRMFAAACEALGLINESLGLDPNDGGAEPILEAIAELKTSETAWLFEYDGTIADMPVGGTAWACIKSPAITFGKPDIDWTHDANKALRFSRREDAEVFRAGYLGLHPREWDERAYRVTEHMWPDLAAPAPQVPSEAARCMCKDRAATDCPGEWEPGCDLGNNAEHVRVSTTDPAVIDAAVAAPAARLVDGEAAECPDCRGSEFRGWKRGFLCATCKGSGMISATDPAQAAPTDAPGEKQ